MSTYWLTQESNATARRLYDKLAEKGNYVEYKRIEGPTASLPVAAGGGSSVPTRRMRPGDKKRFCSLFRGHVAPQPVSDESLELLWSRLMQEHRGQGGFHVPLVAEDPEAKDGEAIAFALPLFHRSTWSTTYYCYLQIIYVDEAHRRKGAGRALIDAVYKGECQGRRETVCCEVLKSGLPLSAVCCHVQKRMPCPVIALTGSRPSPMRMHGDSTMELLKNLTS